MRRLIMFLMLLPMPACTAPREHADIPDMLPEPAPIVAPAPAPAAPDTLPEAVWPEPLQAAPEPTPAALPERVPGPAQPSSRKGKMRNISTPEPPEQIIMDAQRAARVSPTREGYWGSGTHKYLWSPGRIYTIYLSYGVGTKLTLPPSEVLAHALILNPKSFDVNTANVGNELTTHSIILIRPCATSEEGCVPAREVDVAVTSMSGRGYNLHLIVGKVGMVEVEWAITPIPLLEVADPGLQPRRQP